MISDQTKATIRARVDLVELIGCTVPLRRVGGQWRARCPFHGGTNEQSFAVDPRKGVYFCHRCRVAGDAFSWWQHAESSTFPEAVEQLAERAGVALPPAEVNGYALDGAAGRAERARRRETEARLAEALELARAFYADCLLEPEATLGVRDPALLACARRAVDALVARGLSQDAVLEFGIGYAPAAPDALARHLAARGVSPADAAEAGLLRANRSRGGGEGEEEGRAGWHDCLRHRLVFPVLDSRARWRVAGFSGRALPLPEVVGESADDEAALRDAITPETAERLRAWIVPPDAPRYLSTADSPVGRKGELLLGLRGARDRVRRGRDPLAPVVVVEGNFDAASLHAATAALAVVAPMGSAFTPAHARAVARLAEHVVVAYDGDAAGRANTAKALESARAAGLIARAAQLPKGADPDALTRVPGGAAGLEVRVARAPDALEWLIDQEACRAPHGSQPHAARALALLAPRVAAAGADPFARAAHARRLQAAFGGVAAACPRRQLLAALAAGERPADLEEEDDVDAAAAPEDELPDYDPVPNADAGAETAPEDPLDDATNEPTPDAPPADEPSTDEPPAA
jgi:DNA primase